MFRARVIVERPGVGGVEYDPALIGDIPVDWATKTYVLMAVPDPLDPSKPAAQWVDITDLLVGSGSGYGVYGSY